VRKKRMILIPLTVAAAIVAMVMMRRPGKLGSAKRKK
jgi:poly-D-alanine transfer protein DltD